MIKKKEMPGQKFAKACMHCKSFNVKGWSSDDNHAFGANPKYQCMDCGSVGMPIEFPVKKK